MDTQHWVHSLEKVTNDGCQTWIRKDNYIDLQCIRESIIEDQYRLKSLVGKVGVVYDIGACQGVFAVRAADVLDCSVVSLEPHPDNFRILTLNAIENARIRPILGAFSQQKEVFLTDCHHEAANRLANSGIACLGVNAEEIVAMAQVAEKSKPALLKFDFEGGEDIAIADFLWLIPKAYIAGEWHVSPDAVRKALENSGCDNIEVQDTGDITGLFFATYGI